MSTITLTKDITELEEYQEWVASKATTLPPKELMGWWASTILSCEAAEVLELHEKAIRKTGSAIAEVDRVLDELGDTLWCVAAVANAYELSLDDVMMHNIDKINDRTSRQI